MESRRSKSTELTLVSVSLLTADDIWLRPQNKHCGIWMNLLLFHTSLTTTQCHDSCWTTVFGFLHHVWGIFMNCEVNFIFSLSFFVLFSPVCRIACHKKCEVKVRVEPFYVFMLLFFFKITFRDEKTKLEKKLSLNLQSFSWFHASYV